MLQATVLGKQIYDITGRELDIGLLGLANSRQVAHFPMARFVVFHIC